MKVFNKVNQYSILEDRASKLVRKDPCADLVTYTTPHSAVRTTTPIAKVRPLDTVLDHFWIVIREGYRLGKAAF